MKKHLVRLAEAERTELRAFTRSGTRSAQAITRARLLLMADQQGESRNDADIARALALPEVKEWMSSQAGQPGGGSPEELAAFQAAETVKWRKLITSAQIKAE